VLEQWLRENQSWLSKQSLPLQQRVSNVVFMGMGEPLDNVDQVIAAIEVMNDPLGFNLPLRKISVSTAGHLDGLLEITKQLPQVRLALSLHAPNDTERSRLLPINRRWPLGVLMDFFRHRAPSIKHHLLVQYTVIKGVNDSFRHAREMGELLQGIPSKINLIPLNPIGLSRLQSPEAEALQAFRHYLQEQGFRVLVRYSKGQDIAAACGQLVQ
jgi:23S rRNA (adenine2503-C2)-methyltransferase